MRETIENLIKDNIKDEDEAKKLLEYYSSIERDSDFLLALEGAGVDNWDGYSNAQELMEEGDE